jgi:ADP-ribose pyrophosphatase
MTIEFGTMKSGDVEVVERRQGYGGYFRIDRYRLRHRLFDGGWSGEMVREVFERGHAVAVLLYDPNLDRVVLVEQFRVGAFLAGTSRWFAPDFSPWLVECVAGIIDEGETPEEVARREAVEEADCPIGELIPICHYLVSPGGTTESVFLFCGRVDSSKAGGVHGLTEEHENIRVLVAPAAEAFRWLDEGRLVNAMVIIAVQWLKLRHRELRARWRREPAAAGARP